MANCPLLNKTCPESNKGKKGCAWWVDLPTEEGFESMCTQVADVRLAITQIIKLDGNHAAVNSLRNETVKRMDTMNMLGARSQGLLEALDD